MRSTYIQKILFLICDISTSLSRVIKNLWIHASFLIYAVVKDFRSRWKNYANQIREKSSKKKLQLEKLSKNVKILSALNCEDKFRVCWL